MERYEREAAEQQKELFSWDTFWHVFEEFKLVVAQETQRESAFLDAFKFADDRVAFSWKVFVDTPGL